MKACEKYVFSEMYHEWLRKLESGSMFLFSQIWDKNALGKFWRYSTVSPKYARCEINYIFLSMHNDVNFLHKHDTIHFEFSEKKHESSFKHKNMLYLSFFETFLAILRKTEEDTIQRLCLLNLFRFLFRTNTKIITTAAIKTVWNLKFQGEEW